METPGAKLPPIAKQLDVQVVLDAVAGPSKPFEPELRAFRPVAETPELAFIDLSTSGFTDEELAQAREFADTQQFEAPPVGIAPPVELAIEVKPAAPPKSNPLSDFIARPLAPSAVASLAADLTTLHSRYVRGPNPHTKPAEDAKPVVEPPKKEPPKPEPVKAAEPAPKPAEPPQKPAEPSPKPKISIRPAEPAKTFRPEVRRPTTMVARGNAQPVAQEIPEAAPVAPTPPPEPKVVPIRKADPATPPAAKITEAPTLGYSGADAGGSGIGLKIGIAVAALAVLGGIGFFMMKGGSAKSGATPAVTSDTAEALPSLGGAGWTTNWGTEAPSNKGKQISLYRPTMAISDYRIEIQGQIEKKALGWIFRAHDPKNYYVMKLEWLKPGVDDPIPALIKYAVIDGKETTHTQVMLPLDNVTLTTLFKIRTDVKGNKFTTYVNDKRVDYWADSQIEVGGAGLYAEPNERAIIKSTNIAGLR